MIRVESGSRGRLGREVGGETRCGETDMDCVSSVQDPEGGQMPPSHTSGSCPAFCHVAADRPEGCSMYSVSRHVNSFPLACPAGTNRRWASFILGCDSDHLMDALFLALFLVS